MTQDIKDVLKLALEALEELFDTNGYWWQEVDEQTLEKIEHSITAIKEALAEQEPVAWLLTDKNINSLQVESIQRLINRLKHAHHTDLCVRINGQDEWFEADWLKHMVRVTPPQRTEQPPQLKPLTREQEIALREGYCADAESSYFDARADCLDTPQNRRLFVAAFERGWQAAHGIKENT